MDRFDFEQCIMNAWNITDDLQLIYENLLENDMSSDEVANVILGLKNLYQMKFDKLWNGFESLTPVLCAGENVIGQRRVEKLKSEEATIQIPDEWSWDHLNDASPQSKE